MKAVSKSSATTTWIRRALDFAQAFSRRFGREYWAFYCAAACMDLGFGLYIFLFNLYLTDLHFDERVIGRILAAFTLGNLAGTLPGMAIAKKHGLRPLLLLAFTFVPFFSILRLYFLHRPDQIFLAFLSGAALCGWPICFAPTIAQFTTERNRSSAFSLAFATGIGLSGLAGALGGYVTQFLSSSVFHLSAITGIRIVLLIACGVVVLGIVPLLRLEFGEGPAPEHGQSRIFHPYLLRFLPAFLLWNVVTGSFPIFGTIFLQRTLHIPMWSLGLVFGASQLMQFVAVLCAPKLYRLVGVANGVALAQLGTATFLLLLSAAHVRPLALCCYVLYFGAQFMCGPGIYQMLMESIPITERSSASAFQNLGGALCQAGTAAMTGSCIVAFGYRPVLVANAVLAVVASGLFSLLRTRRQASEDPSSDSLIRISDQFKEA